ILNVPEHARVERGVDTATVDQDEELVRDRAVEPARSDRVVAGVDAGNLDAGNVAQELGNAEAHRPPDVVLRDDVDGRGSLGERLGLLRYGCDLDIEELLEAEALQRYERLVFRSGIRGPGGILGPGARRQRNQQHTEKAAGDEGRSAS